MRKQWIVLLLLMVALVACNLGQTADPTPFPTTNLNASPTADNQVLSITLADLAANPEAYEGAQLQLTGEYRRRPLLVCESNPHPSPATWGIVADEVMAEASGLDQLRALIPENLTITVEGRWQHWRGPVGCGKRALVYDVWYLEVSRIVSPSPITNATITPSTLGSTTIIAQLVPTAIVIEATPTSTTADEPPVIVTPPPETLPEATTPPPEEGDGFPTIPVPTIPTVPPTGTSPSPSPTMDNGDEGDEPTAEGDTPTPDSQTGTGTPPAGTPGDATPTSETPGATPAAGTPTLTPTPGTIIEQGEIEDQELVGAQLGANAIHSWSFSLTGADVLTASVVALNADLIISVIDPAGATLAEQNSAPTNPVGQIEVIQNLTLPAAGTYKLWVRTANGAPTYYALMLLYEDSYSFTFRGLLSYGSTETASLPAESDHFWHFSGTAGDNVRIRVTPNGNIDLFLELYNPVGDLISGFVDETGGAQPEELLMTLPDTGVYSIRLGELNYGPGNYGISLIRN